MNDYDPDQSIREDLELIAAIPKEIRERWEARYLSNTCFSSLDTDYFYKKKVYAIRDRASARTGTFFHFLLTISTIILAFTLSKLNKITTSHLVYIGIMLAVVICGLFLVHKQSSAQERAKRKKNESRELLTSKIAEIKKVIPSVVLYDITKNSLFIPSKMSREINEIALTVTNAREQLYILARELAEEKGYEPVSYIEPSDTENNLRIALSEIDRHRKKFLEIWEINDKFGIVDPRSLCNIPKEKGQVLKT